MKQTASVQSQRGAILEWFTARDVADWDEYADAAQSGADDFGKTFRELFILRRRANAGTLNSI